MATREFSDGGRVINYGVLDDKLRRLELSVIYEGLTATPGTITAFTSDELSTDDVTAIEAAIAAHNPNAVTRRTVFLADEFAGNQSSMGLGWTANSFGAGSSVAIGTNEAGASGVIALTAGIKTVARPSYYLSPNALNFGKGALSCEWKVKVPTLADGTTDFDAFIGFGDSTTADEHTDGAYFVYDHDDTDFWICRTANNSVRSEVVTEVTVAEDEWTTLKIECDDNHAEVRFLINGALVATITDNIATETGRDFGAFLKIAKHTGSEARTIVADYFNLNHNLILE